MGEMTHQSGAATGLAEEASVYGLPLEEPTSSRASNCGCQPTIHEHYLQLRIPSGGQALDAGGIDRDGECSDA